MRLALGCALLVVAGLALLAAGRRWQRWRLLRRLPVTTPDHLVGAARAGRLEPGLHAVTGTAAPGPGGELTSVVNQERCVWHRHTVVPEPAGAGIIGRRVLRRTAGKRTESASPEPFALVGEQARIMVRPAQPRVEAAQRLGKRILPGPASKPFPDAAELLASTVQFVHREWVIRTGTPLLVLGPVRVREGRLTLERPALISTRPAGQIRGRALAGAVVGAVIALAALVGGAIVLLTG